MIKHIIASILIISGSLPYNIYAQTPKISYLKSGSKAPFAGYLYNPEAQAEFESKLNLCDQTCRLGIEKELKKQEAKHTLEVGVIKSQLRITEQKGREIATLKDNENKRLAAAYKKELEKNDYNTVYAAGGFVSGVLVVLLTLYTSVKIVK
jgi:hypothetical protein